jgi:glycosyltransferase involved in cell wall biosynthesis
MLVNSHGRIPGYVASQAESVRDIGWDVMFGYVPTPRSPSRFLSSLRRLKQDVAQHKETIVHAQYGSGSALIASCVKGCRPLVISFCGSDLLGTNMPGWRWRIRDRISRYMGVFAAYRASAIIVKSANLLDALPRPLHKKALILPNGVDLNRFRPLDRNECRTRLGWPTDQRIILFNAQWHAGPSTKNPGLAHQAVELGRNKHADWSLFMMSNVTPEQVVLMMNAADCLLMTSLHEGSANVVKEAMACNLPVISVPCGDVPQRLEKVWPSAVCGYDAPLLADGLKSVFQAGVRSNGRAELIRQGLTRDSIAQQLIALYAAVK